ncbi:MAG: hypothetical protein U1A27_07295 [Phycisphaerae bacterium]
MGTTQGNPTIQDFMVLFINAGFTAMQFGIQLLGQLLPVGVRLITQFITSLLQTPSM